MSLAYAAYAGLSAGAFLAFAPFYWLKTRASLGEREMFAQKMGRYPETGLPSGSPRIWIHAVSVGEVKVAQAIIDVLCHRLPEAAILLTTSTRSGQKAAREVLGERGVCLFAPLDFPPAVRRAVQTLRPDALICLETEIWPNLLMAAKRFGIPAAMVNGRLSARSIRSYQKVKPLFKTVLEGMKAFSMIHAADAERLASLGAPLDRIVVNGNAKFDLLLRQIQGVDLAPLRSRYGISENQKVVVAGSTRGMEPEMVLGAFRKVAARFPEAVLIIVPRHVRHAMDIKARALTHGFTCQLRSDLDRVACSSSVVVVDVMGELQALYGLATVVFCGGSLVPLGGQNIIEAAAWGKPVLHGPSMEDFPDARELLERNGGAVEVKNEEELAVKMLHYLATPADALALGDRARSAVEFCRGAADRHADVILSLLPEAHCSTSLQP